MTALPQPKLTAGGMAASTGIAGAAGSLAFVALYLVQRFITGDLDDMIAQAAVGVLGAAFMGVANALRLHVWPIVVAWLAKKRAGLES